MSSNLGMRIKGDVFEVGFEAETREEFDRYMLHVALIADQMWPAEEPTSEEQDAKSLERMQATEVQINRTAKNWREGQGLR